MKWCCVMIRALHLSTHPALLKWPKIGPDFRGTGTTQFNKPADAVALQRPLRDGLINVVQVYDWMDEHHRPWRVGYDYWQDIAARDPWVSRTKLLELIQVGQSLGMASMAYNLMYGAYENFQSTSPVDPSWGLYQSGGLQDAHPLNIPGWETQSLALFDPGHVGWQDWIAARTAEAFRRCLLTVGTLTPWVTAGWSSMTPVSRLIWRRRTRTS